MSKRKFAQQIVAALVALSIGFTPLARFSPLAPTPAKASLGDCWDAGVDAIENGVKIAGLTLLDEKFLECAGKIASMDVVSIAVDAAFTVWGALGKFDSFESCTTAVKETIVSPLYDLLKQIPSDVVSFIDGILALGGELFVGIYNQIVDAQHQVNAGKLTLADIIAAGVDYLYEILEQAVPTIFDYITCGCKMSGALLQVAKFTGEVAKEAWACAQSFCIVNCDDQPPAPPGVWQACAPGDRKWYNWGSDGTFIASFPCNGCPLDSTTKTYSEFELVSEQKKDWFGNPVFKDGSPVMVLNNKEVARYDYCSCPEGEGYQSAGMEMGDFVDSKGNKTGQSALVAKYACEPCPPYSSREEDGKSCIKCGLGKGTITKEKFDAKKHSIDIYDAIYDGCEICGTCQGTLEDGTCGSCPPGQGIFAGLCGICPPEAPINTGCKCESCPPGTKYDPASGKCDSICTSGLVYGYDVKQKKNDCVPCEANTYATYVSTTTGLATGGDCPSCATGYSSEAGQAECKKLDCEHGLNTTGHGCAVQCMSFEMGTVIFSPSGGYSPGPMTTQWICADSPLMQGFPVPTYSPPPEQSKGNVPWTEWKMKVEEKFKVLEKVNIRVQEKTSGPGYTGVQIKVKKEQNADKTSQQKYKTMSPQLELPGGGTGSQMPSMPGGATSGGFKTMQK